MFDSDEPQVANQDDQSISEQSEGNEELDERPIIQV
jgi:hypothetical protein